MDEDIFTAPRPGDVSAGEKFTPLELSVMLSTYRERFGAEESKRMAADLRVTDDGFLLFESDFVTLRFVRHVIRCAPGWGVDRESSSFTAAGVNDRYWEYLANFPGPFDVSWIDWIVAKLVR